MSSADTNVLMEQRDALTTLLAHPDAEDHICWSLVDMLDAEIEERFSS